MADNAKQQLLDDIRSKAINKYDLTAAEYEPIAEDFYTKVFQENWDEARTAIKKHEKQQDWDLSEELEFLNRIADPDEVEQIDSGDVKQDMSSREKLLIKRQLKEQEGDGFLASSDNSVGTEQLFDLHESFYHDTGKLAFVISNQNTWDGRVSVELSDTKNRYELLSVYENKDGEKFFKHFGQSNPNKGYNKIDELNKSFYEYKFVADDQEYLALSTERLDTVRCKLKGTKISLNDYKTVGEFSKLAVNRDIIFVHSVDPAIETMTEKELDEYREDLTHDDLAESLLGKWRQPKWFEQLQLAQLMVNDENGYPSHMIWIGPPGTGKSKDVESVLRSMAENQQEPFTGSGSTVKGLVPSFKESPPDEGYLLKTQRVAGVDEKMDLLSNSIQNGNEASNDVFRPLLNLLTHDTRKFESGNGSIKGQMMSTMIATGNFNAYGIKDMKDLAEKIDSAYLSRNIVYSQTESHMNFIKERKAEVKQKMQEDGLTEEDLFPVTDDDFVSMMDTLRDDRHAVIDFMKVDRIHKDLMELAPGYMREIFKSRGAHHMENITLGIVKYNFMVNNRDNFEAKDEDYQTMKKIFELIISGWDDVDPEQMSFAAKKQAITHAQREVFNVIDDSPGCTGQKVADETDVDSLSWALTELKKLGLVTVDEESEDREIWPWWTDEYKEIEDVDEDKVIY